MAFSAVGYPSILTARSVDHLSKVKEECLKAGAPEVEMVEVDFLSDNPLKDLGQMQSTPSILINNAGDFFIQRSAGCHRSRLYSTIHRKCLRNHTDYKIFLLPALGKLNQALVVNICSKASVVGYNDASAYTVSKHALYGYGKSLRASSSAETAPHVAKIPMRATRANRLKFVGWY